MSPLLIFLSLLGLALCHLHPVTESGVIYGHDDRLDYYEITDPDVLKLADSAVAIVGMYIHSVATRGVFYLYST